MSKSLKNLSDKELASTLRLDLQEITDVAEELTRRGYEVYIQIYKSGDGCWENESNITKVISM